MVVRVVVCTLVLPLQPHVEVAVKHAWTSSIFTYILAYMFPRATTWSVWSVRCIVLLLYQPLLTIVLSLIVLLLRVRKWHRPSAKMSMMLCPLRECLVLWRLNRICRCILIPYRESLWGHSLTLWCARGMVGKVAVDSSYCPRKDCHIANGLHELWVIRSTCCVGMRFKSHQVWLKFLANGNGLLWLVSRDNRLHSPRSRKQTLLLRHTLWLLLLNWLSESVRCWFLLWNVEFVWVDTSNNNYHAVGTTRNDCFNHDRLDILLWRR